MQLGPPFPPPFIRLPEVAAEFATVDGLDDDDNGRGDVDRLSAAAAATAAAAFSRPLALPPLAAALAL